MELIEKPLELKQSKKIMFDQKTNNEIKKIINKNSKVVRPGYKKKISAQIQKIKQKKKHEYIDSLIHKRLLKNNIRRTKEEFYK
jgi:23S rRNA G2069 N7-methylase RlmK/C1962 C5-methylase RlmI